MVRQHEVIIKNINKIKYTDFLDCPILYCMSMPCLLFQFPSLFRNPYLHHWWLAVRVEDEGRVRNRNIRSGRDSGIRTDGDGRRT